MKNVNDNYNKILPTRLRELILLNNITIKAVAESVGVTRQAFSQYQDGSTQPNAETLVKIAKYFNVSTDYLLGLTDAPTIDKDLRFVCDYMGLSEECIKGLRELQHGLRDEFKGFVEAIINCLIENKDLYQFAFKVQK